MTDAGRTIGVAIAIPEPHGSALQQCRESYGDPLAQAIPTHVTLLQPTQVGDAELDGIEDHLRKVAEAEVPFEIWLRGTGTFRPVSPVVFVALAKGISECERIEAAVRSGPLARQRPFYYHPHVTVAHDLPDGVLDHAFAELGGYSARFEVWGFAMYEHGPDGLWRPQRDYPFGRGVPGPDVR